MSAAIWSAIAASLSAFSALMMVLIHRRNLLEASRPELVLTGFTREPGDKLGGQGFEILRIKEIRNVGKGAALNVVIHSSSDTPDDRPLASLGAVNLPIIPAGETLKLDAEAVLFWMNAPKTPMRHLTVSILIWSWDARSIRHVTTYEVFLLPPIAALAFHNVDVGGDQIRRLVTSRPVWLLKFLRMPRWMRPAQAKFQRWRKARGALATPKVSEGAGSA